MEALMGSLAHGSRSRGAGRQRYLF